MRATSQARVVCLCVRAYSCSAVCFVRREELWNGIAQVNAFFVDKERSLLAELQNSADDDASRVARGDARTKLAPTSTRTWLRPARPARPSRAG